MSPEQIEFLYRTFLQPGYVRALKEVDCLLMTDIETLGRYKAYYQWNINNELKEYYIQIRDWLNEYKM